MLTQLVDSQDPCINFNYPGAVQAHTMAPIAVAQVVILSPPYTKDVSGRWLLSLIFDVS
jgi:hypothetical protein